jgi:protein-tyrosine phosphatase
VIDIHTHILPFLDDGVKTLEEALKALKGLSELGFTEVVSTTHFYPGRYTPSAEAVATDFKELQGKLKDDKIPIEIFLGR